VKILFFFYIFKWLGHDTDHLPPSYLGVKNAWSHATPSSSQYAFMAWCLIKQWIRLYGVVLS